MIEQQHADRLGEPRNPLCHGDVGGAGLGRARWVIVGQQNAVRADVEGAAEKETKVHFDLRRGSRGDPVIGEIAPLRRDEGRMQAFDRRFANREAEVAPVIRVGRRNRRPTEFFVQRCLEQTSCREDFRDKILVVGEGPLELRGRRAEGTAQPAEMRDQPVRCTRGSVAGERLEELRQDRYRPRWRIRLA